MNWMVVGAIAIAAIALLGVGSAVFSTSSAVQVSPAIAIGAAPTGGVGLNLCTPGTFGCDKNPGP